MNVKNEVYVSRFKLSQVFFEKSNMWAVEILNMQSGISTVVGCNSEFLAEHKLEQLRVVLGD